MKAAATGSRWVGMSFVVVVCFASLVTAAATISASAAPEATVSSSATLNDRAVGRGSGSRTLTFVYDGSAFVLDRQHVDNRPGHSGPEFDDTYTTQVHWSIAWKVTIEDERVLVGTPTATVTGTDSADANSAGHSSCKGNVEVPVVDGKPSVRTNFVIVSRTQQFLTVRLEGFPPGWATAPSCDIAASGYVPQPDGPAGVKWVYSWGQPEFKIALFNNYKITPAEVGNRYPAPLPPNNIWKKVMFDWSGRLTIEGFNKPTTTAPPVPTPPAKKPCTPKSQFDFWVNDRFPNIYLTEAVETIPLFWGSLRNPDGSDSPVMLKLIQLVRSRVTKADFGISLICGSALFRIGAQGPEPLNVNARARDDLAKLIFPPDEGEYLDIESSPDVLSAKVQGLAGGGTQINGAYTAEGLAALASGKPLRITVTGTFHARGKTPLTTTTKVTLQGPPPVAAINSVTVTGTPQNPAFVVQGMNLGTRPAPNPSGSPSNQPLCPVLIKGNAGLDYGTSLYVNDNTGNFSAGRYRSSLNELDCIGLVVTKFTPTEVDFRPGNAYQQFFPKYQINDGDAIEIAVNGVAKTVHIKYGTAVSN